MDIQIRKGARWAVACPTSMGVRITPADRMAVHNSDMFYMQATSAETNVLNVASSLGMECLALTRFVAGSPVAAFIKAQLRKRNIRYEGKEVPQDGPWGWRHQFNIADSGFGLRAVRVWNDRAGEVGRTLNAADFDTERIFGEEGVGILHLSGLIAALSEDTTACCLALAETAKKHGTIVSFDLNHRASFWEGRETGLRAAFREIASLSDVLLGSEEDFRLCLGLEIPGTGGFREMVSAARTIYPNVSVFAATLQEVLSANRNLWGAVMAVGGEWYTEEKREIDVLDMIGCGDAFTGGLLYGILRGWEPSEWIRFGWACGALAAGSLNDYAEPADERQVRAVYDGNARIQR